AAVPFAFVIWLIFSKRDNRPLFGAARFAKQSEIAKAGLLGTEGIIIGKRGKQFLMYSGDSHARVAAPTRGGKGVGIVIP
ncbi:type IV secretory system conjugative DNA transfer family protein, partial [Xanthomonas euvesicatoria]